MKTYVLRYALLAPLLFLLLYFESFSPFFTINALQTALVTQLTATCIGLFGLPVEMTGNYLYFDNGVELYIIHECNAMASTLLYSAAVLAYPTSKQSKAAWILLGYFALLILNEVRIIGISYGVALDPSSFAWSHNYLGRYGMGILTLALFALFTHLAPIVRKKIPYENKEATDGA